MPARCCLSQSELVAVNGLGLLVQHCAGSSCSESEDLFETACVQIDIAVLRIWNAF